jgi:hypothetical protein
MAPPIASGAVDALVSNTNNFTVVTVRPDSYLDRLWVLRNNRHKALKRKYILCNIPELAFKW